MTGKSSPKTSSPEDEDNHGLKLSPGEVSTASFVSAASELEIEEPLRRRLDLRSLSEGVAALVFPSVGNHLGFIQMEILHRTENHPKLNP